MTGVQTCALPILNDAGKAKLQELYSRIQPEGNYEWFSDLWGIDKETANLYEWNLENIGSKWCYFDEHGSDYFRIISAWSYPDSGIRWVIQQLAEVDPDVIARVIYEDEMPNFFGAAVYNKDGFVDHCEWESEEIEELMKERMASFQDLVEGTDDYGDEYNLQIWDLVHEEQDNFIEAVIFNNPD